MTATVGPPPIAGEPRPPEKRVEGVRTARGTGPRAASRRPGRVRRRASRRDRARAAGAAAGDGAAAVGLRAAPRAALGDAGDRRRGAIRPASPPTEAIVVLEPTPSDAEAARPQARPSGAAPFARAPGRSGPAAEAGSRRAPSSEPSRFRSRPPTAPPRFPSPRCRSRPRPPRAVPPPHHTPVHTQPARPPREPRATARSTPNGRRRTCGGRPRGHRHRAFPTRVRDAAPPGRCAESPGDTRSALGGNAPGSVGRLARAALGPTSSPRPNGATRSPLDGRRTPAARHALPAPRSDRATAPRPDGAPRLALEADAPAGSLAAAAYSVL